MCKLLFFIVLLVQVTFSLEKTIEMNKFQAKALLLDFANRSAQEIRAAKNILLKNEKPESLASFEGLNEALNCEYIYLERFNEMNLDIKSCDEKVISVQQIETTPWTINKSEETQFVPDSLTLEVEYFNGNFYSTNFTALVRIRRARIEDEFGRPTDIKKGYVHHVYEAEIVELYRGEPRKIVTYYVMAEAGIRLYLPEYPLMVSLCSSSQSRFNRYYTPDNGYDLPASKEMIEEARKLAKVDDGRVGTACE